MMQSYELWRDNESNFMFGVPNPERGQHIHAPGAELLLRFDAPSYDAAKLVYERFLFGGNADQLIPLNIPASQFFFSAYRCGAIAGQIVEAISSPHFAKGTRLVILPGDIDAPEIIWMQVATSSSPTNPVGQFGKVLDDVHFFELFQKTDTAL